MEHTVVLAVYVHIDAGLVAGLACNLKAKQGAAVFLLALAHGGQHFAVAGRAWAAVRVMESNRKESIWTAQFS